MQTFLNLTTIMTLDQIGVNMETCMFVQVKSNVAVPITLDEPFSAHALVRMEHFTCGFYKYDVVLLTSGI